MHKQFEHETRSGFTLLEMLFAVTIFAGVLLMSYSLLTRQAEMSQASVTLSVAQTRAQTMLFRLEQELSHARGAAPVAASALALSSSTTGLLQVDSTKGFPPSGMLLIDRGTANVERLAYATLPADGQHFRNLTRGVQCTNPTNHAANAVVLWDGLAEVLALGSAPPASDWDGKALEASGTSYFRGDGSGFSYRLPTDPAGGNDYLAAGALQWGAAVGGVQAIDGWASIYFVPRRVVREADLGIDINHDGDKLDTFDVGQIVKRTWSTTNPGSAPIERPLSPTVMLQEQCHWGRDLDGDGFDDPMFLWDPATRCLHVRLFVLGEGSTSRASVRKVESLVFLRNDDS